MPYNSLGSSVLMDKINLLDRVPRRAPTDPRGALFIFVIAKALSELFHLHDSEKAAVCLEIFAVTSSGIPRVERGEEVDRFRQRSDKFSEDWKFALRPLVCVFGPFECESLKQCRCPELPILATDFPRL